MVMLGFATALTDLMLIDKFTHLWIWCWVLQKKIWHQEIQSMKPFFTP
jgi:hypothetical protein